MRNPEAEIMCSVTKLIRLLSERVQLLEQRSPGRTPFPAADFLAHLESLGQCVELLEARPCVDAALRAPEPLARCNAEKHSRGEQLRDAIGHLLEHHPGPPHGAAKRIYPHLLETDIGRSAQPSLRTVQHHITQLRNAGGVA